jgi:hypothetical protein
LGKPSPIGFFRTRVTSSSRLHEQRRHEPAEIALQHPWCRAGHIRLNKDQPDYAVVVLPVNAAPDMFYVNNMLERLKSSEPKLLNKLF